MYLYRQSYADVQNADVFTDSQYAKVCRYACIQLGRKHRPRFFLMQFAYEHNEKICKCA
jgi:hypothetical protein